MEDWDGRDANETSGSIPDTTPTGGDTVEMNPDEINENLTFEQLLTANFTNGFTWAKALLKSIEAQPEEQREALWKTLFISYIDPHNTAGPVLKSSLEDYFKVEEDKTTGPEALKFFEQVKSQNLTSADQCVTMVTTYLEGIDNWDKKAMFLAYVLFHPSTFVPFIETYPFDESTIYSMSVETVKRIKLVAYIMGNNSRFDTFAKKAAAVLPILRDMSINDQVTAFGVALSETSMRALEETDGGIAVRVFAGGPDGLREITPRNTEPDLFDLFEQFLKDENIFDREENINAKPIEETFADLLKDEARSKEPQKRSWRDFFRNKR